MSNHKIWGQMTPEEKGALLLAHHEGKTIEVSYGLPGDGWVKSNEPDWEDNLAYRVKPGPEVKTQELYWQMGRNPTANLYGSDTHKITITLENNKPVDIKIEKL